MTFVSAQVECSDKDLHYGVYGGSVHEAMTDLISLMGELRIVALGVSTFSLREVGRVLFLNYLCTCLVCSSILHGLTQPSF